MWDDAGGGAGKPMKNNCSKITFILWNCGMLKL